MHLDTGDLVFFGNPSSLLSRFIQWGDCSKVSHVGVVVNNPPWLSEPVLALLESGSEDFPDIEIHEQHFGVRLSKLEDVVKAYRAAGGSVWVRCSVYELDPSPDTLNEIHLKVHNRPYDATPRTWIGDYLGWRDPATDDRFTCSALAAFVLMKLGVLSPGTDYTAVTPATLLDDAYLPSFKALEPYAPTCIDDE